MSTMLYNVIWIDDEISSLYSGIRSETAFDNRELCRKKGINIIPCKDMSEFDRAMEAYQDRVDAVITDINFPEYGVSEGEESEDVSGFEAIKRRTGKYQSFGREILFFVYSGKLHLGNHKYHPVFKDRTFNKSQYLGDVLDAIIRDVNHLQSPSFRVRNRYKEELKAASLIPQNEEYIFSELLKDEMNENGKRLDNSFNGARKVIERILDDCKMRNIVPQTITSLNDFSKFLSLRHEHFAIREGGEVMPLPIAQCVYHFLQLVQDASHSKEELPLKVDEFVYETQNKNLLRSVIHILMDICLWHKRYITDHPVIGQDNQPWIYVKEKGVVEKVNGTILVCGKVQLANEVSEYISAGDYVGVIKTLNNNTPINSGEKIIDRYAKCEDVVRLSALYSKIKMK